MAWGRINWTIYNRKHTRDDPDWGAQVDGTRHNPAKYRGDAGEQERLERRAIAHDCKDESVLLENVDIHLTHSRRIDPESVHQVYMICDEIIGASLGKDTRIVLAQWHPDPDGTLHGRPISEEELRKKLRKNPEELAWFKEHY